MNRRSCVPGLINLTAIVLMAAVNCSFVLASESSLKLEMEVVFQSAHGPEILGLVRNNGRDAVDILLLANSGLRPSCIEPKGVPLVWPDPLLTYGAPLHLEPGGWYAVIRPTQLMSRAIAGCVAAVEVYDNSKSEVGAKIASASKRLIVAQRTQIRPRVPGSFSVSHAVATMKVGSILPLKESENLIQLQLQVSNLSSDWRDIAVIGRQLVCSPGGKASFVSGPGELPQGLQSGPAQLTPNGWIVFTHRIRVSGDTSKCRADMEFAEWLYDSNGIQPHWVTFDSIATTLIPSGTATYRVAH